jgi:hypothetical protein
MFDGGSQHFLGIEGWVSEKEGLSREEITLAKRKYCHREVLNVTLSQRYNVLILQVKKRDILGFQGPVQCGKQISDPRGLLEAKFGGRSVHFALQGLEQVFGPSLQ